MSYLWAVLNGQCERLARGMDLGMNLGMDLGIARERDARTITVR